MRLAHPPTLLATWFGAGLLPKAPGTWGALAALPCGAILKYYTNIDVFIIATIVVFLIGIWACEAYIAHIEVDDPPSAVIDEVAAQWLVLWFTPLHPVPYILAFVAFRLFDILKPWPVSWLDRHLKGGFGTMVDDIVAALYALAVLYGLSLLSGGFYALSL
jgi:phosphatidylglycerophosphatase A